MIPDLGDDAICGDGASDGGDAEDDGAHIGDCGRYLALVSIKRQY